MSGKPGMGIILAIGPKKPAAGASGGPQPLPQRKSAAQEPPKDQMPEPDAAPEVANGGIPAEAVSYRSEREVCGNCEYMGDDSECTKLLFHVEPGAGCNLFE